MNQLDNSYIDSERGLPGLMNRSAIPLLRLSLAVTYIWFGALKLIGKSPVSDLVKKTAFFIPQDIAMPLMGIWEVAIGVGLLLRFPLRLTLLALFGQLAGTFMVLFVRPREAFERGNPFLLTERGEFVVKNFVLLAAGMAVASTANRKTETVHPTGEEE
jgi:uncharacterized membrane protein YkgB